MAFTVVQHYSSIIYEPNRKEGEKLSSITSNYQMWRQPSKCPINLIRSSSKANQSETVSMKSDFADGKKAKPTNHIKKERGRKGYGRKRQKNPSKETNIRAVIQPYMK